MFYVVTNDAGQLLVGGTSYYFRRHHVSMSMGLSWPKGRERGQNAAEGSLTDRVG